MSKNENKNKNLVYIIDCDGNELPPTSRRGRVRKLLDSGQAVVVKKKPFTIKLKYDCYDDFQKEEKKQLLEQTGEPLVDVDKNINNKGDEDMSVNNIKLNKEKEKEVYKPSRIPIDDWISEGTQRKRLSDTSLKELIEMVGVKEIDKKDILATISFSIDEFNNVMECGSEEEKTKMLEMFRDVHIKKIWNYVVYNSDYILNDCVGTYNNLANQYFSKFMKVMRRQDVVNNYLQLSVFHLIRAIAYSFTDDECAVEKLLNILNAMVLYNDLDCKEDYIPYISALLNIPPKKDYNVKLLNKISFPECTRRVDTVINSQLNKYGDIDGGLEALFYETMGWVAYSSLVENGLQKSLRATYYFVLSIVKYQLEKTENIRIYQLINHMLDERRKQGYWKLMVEAALENEDAIYLNYYETYLEICECNRPVVMNYDVEEQIKNHIKTQLSNYDNEHSIAVFINEITLYRAANQISLDQEFDASKDMNVFVFNNARSKLLCNSNSNIIFDTAKEDAFFF